MNRADASAASQMIAKASTPQAAQCGGGRAAPGRPARLTTRVSRASRGDSTMTATATTIASGASTIRRTQPGWEHGVRLPSSPAGQVSGQPGEIARRGRIGTLDALADPSLIPVPQLGQVWRGPVSARGQDVHLDVLGQRRHFLVEPVPAGDLEGDQTHLPRPPRHRQRALDPADVQDVDGTWRRGRRPARPGWNGPGRRRSSARRRPLPAAAGRARRTRPARRARSGRC